jgi:hypothetical protein
VVLQYRFFLELVKLTLSLCNSVSGDTQ